MFLSWFEYLIKASFTPGCGQPHLVQFVSAIYYNWRRGWDSYIGRVGGFCWDKETFCAYVEGMEMFYTANNIVKTPGTERVAANPRVAEQKKAIFVAEVDPEVYSVLSNLLSPAKP